MYRFWVSIFCSTAVYWYRY